MHRLGSALLRLIEFIKRVGTKYVVNRLVPNAFDCLIVAMEQTDGRFH
jgi:hypothetical protein